MKMKMKSLPPTSYLHECLSYDPDSGILTWRRRPAAHFASAGICTQWNSSHAGKKAGTASHATHIVVSIDKSRYLCHRVIWKMMTGNDPIKVIDHEDRNGKNNLWTNLREATQSQNLWNAKNFVNNTSGFRGVNKHAKGRFRAQVSHRYLGLFDTAEEAAEARRNAVKQIAGEFYRED